MDAIAPPPEPVPSPPRRRMGCKILGAVALLALAVVGWLAGPVLWDFWKAGMFRDVKKRTYAGTTMDNLKAMHMAMMVYHDSEEAFPEASGWMDAIEPRIQVSDMAKSETEKKLISPEFLGQKGKYGYAMNDAASRKYRDDIPEPETTPLIFDSKDTTRNAHGRPEDLLPNPPRDGMNRGVSVAGQMLELSAR